MTPQRKLGWEIAGLLGFVLSILGLLEWKYKNYSTDVDDLIRKFEYKKSTAQVLWLGNSHTLPIIESIDQQDKTSQVASLAHGGIDLFLTHELVQKYLNELPQLKLILLGIDEDMLGYNQSVFRVEYGSRAFYRYTDTIYKNSRIERILAKSNFFRSNRDLSYLFSSKTSNASYLASLDTSIFRSIGSPCQQRAHEHSAIRFSRKLLHENTLLLQKIIAQAREKNRTLILFIPPKSNCYLEYRNQENIAEARAILDSLVLAEGVDLFEMNRAMVYPDSLFRDPDHLNLKGAQIGVKQLFKYISEKDSLLSERLKPVFSVVPGISLAK